HAERRDLSDVRDHTAARGPRRARGRRDPRRGDEQPRVRRQLAGLGLDPRLLRTAHRSPGPGASPVGGPLAHAGMDRGARDRGGDAVLTRRTVGRSDSRTEDGGWMPSSIFLGADAGGSHSTVVIGTADLTILGRADGPPAAMKPGGAPASAAVLSETGRRAAFRGSVDLPVERAVVAAAGAGRPQERADLEAALVQAGLARRVRVMADGEVARSPAFA